MVEKFRGLLLFLLPLPLAFKSVAALWGGDVGALAANAGCYALFLGAALIARSGMVAERQLREQRRARPGRLPRKTIGGVLVAIATALTAFFAAGHGLPAAAAFGLAAGAAFFLAYGFDPRPKVLDTKAHGVAADELTAALDEAYGRLDRIDAARQGIQVREFQQRLANIVDGTRKILTVIEEDPRDLRRARRFLNVYLGGLETVTEQYARTHRDVRDAELEHRYRSLLVDMENACVEQHEKLLRNDTLDLDVRIEVLSERLRREGVL